MKINENPCSRTTTITNVPVGTIFSFEGRKPGEYAPFLRVHGGAVCLHRNCYFEESLMGTLADYIEYPDAEVCLGKAR